MPTLHLLIKGKVQGVFYRASAKDIAKQIGVTGWIKNTVHGDVEAVVFGSQAQVEEFTEWCKTGPARAVVIEVIVTPQADQLFVVFNIER